MKWGCFLKTVENGGVFCKNVDLSSTQGALCTVSISIFYFAFYLFGGGAYAPNAPPLPVGLKLLFFACFRFLIFHPFF